MQLHNTIDQITQKFHKIKLFNNFFMSVFKYCGFFLLSLPQFQNFLNNFPIDHYNLFLFDALLLRCVLRETNHKSYVKSNKRNQPYIQM